MRIENIYDTFPIVDCGNYILRPVLEKDREQVFEIYSNEEVVKYQATKVFRSMEESDQAIKRFKNAYDSQNSIKWCISDKADDEMIGLISLHHIDCKNNNAQIGYYLRRELWNKGIMSKLVKDYIKYLFEKWEIEKLEVSIHPENLSSIRLAEKLGFEKEGFRRRCVINPETKKYEDRILMGLLKV